MATYCYFNQDQQLTINIPVLRWSPIISILCCQGGFALGLGIIPYMYQVFFQSFGSDSEGVFAHPAKVP